MKTRFRPLIHSASFMTLVAGSSTLFAASPFWTEKGDSAPLVVLPSLAPVVEKVDNTIVNVSGSSDPKRQREEEMKKNPRDRRERQGPADPFSNPEEFFERFFGQPNERQAAPRRVLGSGFIISKDGYILTNNHVVEGTDKIEITLLGSKAGKKNENKFPAKLVGSDPATDVALLKIDTGFDLPALPLGDSAKLQKGEWVMAFGNPFGLDHSVSAGIISATEREISPNQNRRFDDFIQTDAAINFGNSGGPLVNLKGEAIGINTAITAQGSGIGFAVPMNMVKDIIVQLKDSGSVTRGYLGITIGDVTEELKEAKGLAAAKGVIINDIVPGGPASKSELQREDIVLKVNGAETNSAKELQQNVAKIKPGAQAKLEVLRGKKTLTVSVKVGNLSESSAQPEKATKPDGEDRLGILVGMASDGSGVQIQGIEAGSAADEAGLVEGDIVRRIKDEAVKNIADYQRIVKGLKSKSHALFDIQRGDLKSFIVVKVP